MLSLSFLMIAMNPVTFFKQNCLERGGQTEHWQKPADL